ncbi:MAG: hypothetical protein AAGF81_15585 [Pseudomonadota bacterium]
MIKPLFASALVLAAMSASVLAGPKCTCRYQGENYNIGEVACILGELKQCEMTLNNTSWRTLSEGCPQAQVPQSKPKVSLQAFAGNGKTAAN